CFSQEFPCFSTHGCYHLNRNRICRFFKRRDTMSETVKGLLGMAVLFLLGVVMICFPQVLWKSENFLTTKGGEPSDFYLVVMRVGGTLFIMLGIIFLTIWIFAS